MKEASAQRRLDGDASVPALHPHVVRVMAESGVIAHQAAGIARRESSACGAPIYQ